MLTLLKRYRELLLVAALLVTPIAVFLAHAKKPVERSAVDRTVVAVLAPVERLLAAGITGVLDGWRATVGLRGAHERAEALSREANLLRVERAELEAARLENERLRRLVGVLPAPGRAFVGARVIVVRLGVAGLQLVTIDRGADDGLARAMPVVTGDGVVGRIHGTTARTADVLLAIDLNSSIAARVARTRARANVRGLGAPDAARLDYALRAEDVIEGDLLVTSGTDGVFPPGLPVGRVTGLRRGSHGLFLEGQVVPAVDPTRLEEVLVLAAGALDREVRPAAAAEGEPR